MRNGKNLAMMMLVSGGLSVALAVPSAARASCGAYSGRQQSYPDNSFQNTETPEQREARIAEQKAAREARRAAKLAKKAAKEAVAVVSN